MRTKQTHTNDAEEIKAIAKKALDMYINQHMDITLAILLQNVDCSTALKVKEYIALNY